MSASPVETARDRCIRFAFRYLLVTVFCALFGAIYELFSHGVYAYGMIYAFAIPLVGGLVPAMILMKYDGLPLPSPAAVQLWNFGLSALTVGSLFSGALEIYGTTSRFTVVYWLIGGVLLLVSLLMMLFLPDRAN